MANTPVKFLRSYSSALTAKLVSAGGTGTPNASGYACTNSNGLQTFTVAEDLVGLFYVYVHDANDEIAYNGFVVLADTTDTCYVVDEIAIALNAATAATQTAPAALRTAVGLESANLDKLVNAVIGKKVVTPVGDGRFDIAVRNAADSATLVTIRHNPVTGDTTIL